MYIAFLDEFGHIGPFVSRADKRYNHSPVFGLAGYLLPHQNVRSFATWFFQFKNDLLAAELAACGQHPATWEKKGIELFTTKNIKKYPSIRSAASRLLNQIYKRDGKIFYYGRQKYQSPQKSNPSGLYTTVLSHSMRDIDRFCAQRNEQFMFILDQHSDRLTLLETAAKTMFGNAPVRNLIEPPFQVESHLYQTIQAADWIATLVGRLLAYRVEPQQFSDWEWAERIAGTKIDANTTHSSLWRKPKAPTASIGITAAATSVTTIVGGRKIVVQRIPRRGGPV
jgi:hypothetical protein